MTQHPPSVTQEEIDNALRATHQLRQEKTVSLKNLTGGLAIGGLLAAAVFKFWFGAISALPFMYTQDWHDGVQKSMEKVEPALRAIAVVEANQTYVNSTLMEIKRTQERQADDLTALRRLLEELRDERRRAK